MTSEQKENVVEYTLELSEKIQDIEGWNQIETAEGRIFISKTYTEDTEEEIQLIDEAGNVTKYPINIQIVQITDIITSDNLKISEDELTIKGINPKTTVSNFKNNINAEMEYQILDKNGKIISNTGKVGTGCQIKMQSGKIYTIIVWGDLDGDGQISLTELAKISKIGVNKIEPTNLEKLAIDMNANGKIELSELAAIAKLQVK